MNTSKFLLSALIILITFISIGAQSPNITINNNRHGLVSYNTTDANPNTGVFILFGNGHFSRNLNPTHYFGPSNGFTTKAYYLDPYTQNPPLYRSIGTGTTGSGSHSNVPYHMTTETKIETSWNATQAHDAYYVLLFKNTTSNVMNGCLNFYYKDEEILINTNGILEQTGWVSNREFLTQNNGIYNRRFRWSFSNLNPNEQRVVYIPFKSKLPHLNNLNVSSSMSTNCNYVPSSLPNQSFKVSAYPHDPNLKSVSGCIDVLDERSQKLGFTIDFQNIGTGPANVVVIEDQLHEDLDINTVSISTAQYPFTYETFPNNKLIITFTNINLQGIQQEGVNIDETKSSVSFNICSQTNPGCFTNTATITFDNQPSITTNSVYVCDYRGLCTPEICPPSSEGFGRLVIENNLNDIVEFEAFPNPVNDVLNIRFSSETSQIHLINIAGQIVENYDIDMHIREKSIDMSNLNSGIYFLRVIGQNFNKTVKLIKN